MQITKDQSLMQKLVEAGELTAEEAEQSERRNIILQALGPEPNIKVDLTRQQLRRGDTLVLCSDGLCGQVRTEEIATDGCRRDLTGRHLQRLIDLANETAGRTTSPSSPRGSTGAGWRSRTPADGRRATRYTTIPDQAITADRAESRSIGLREPRRGAARRTGAPHATQRDGHAVCSIMAALLAVHRAPAQRPCSERARQSDGGSAANLRLAWVGALSFASGLPYFGIFNETWCRSGWPRAS